MMDKSYEQVTAELSAAASSLVADIVRDVVKQRMQWIEARLSELLAAGIAKDDIEIRNFPDCSVQICAHGVPCFEWKLKASTPHSYTIDNWPPV